MDFKQTLKYVNDVKKISVHHGHSPVSFRLFFGHYGTP